MKKIAEESAFQAPLFQKKYLEKGIPVIYRKYAKNWPAVKKWSPAYLEKKLGKTRLNFQDDPESPFRTISLSRFVQKLEKKEALPYFRNVFLDQVFPSLMKDVKKIKLAEPNFFNHPLLTPLISPRWQSWYEFFLSEPMKRFPYIHQDRLQTHAWILQIYGRKRIWLWPPLAAKKPKAHHFYTRPGQDLTNFFKKSKPIVAEIGPGDLLFIPKDWWHTAESQTVSITLSGNWVGPTNWSHFFEEYFFHSKKMPKAARETLLELKEAICKSI